MTRLAYIEQIRRFIYNEQPSDDATITVELVNVWLDQAIAFAAKRNYTDSIALEGVEYINNSFYTTFKGLTISKDENFLYKVTLPQIPLGIGTTEGISTLTLKSGLDISYSVIFLTQNQKSFQRGMRPIPNKLLAYTEGQYAYILSAYPLSSYTANVCMISGGNSSDLTSTINVPNDYFPIMTDYLVKNLLLERNQPVDVTNDGMDAIKTT